MNIGILGHGFVTWGGGVDFLKNFIACLLSADDAAAHQVTVLIPVADMQADPPAFYHDFIRDLPGAKILLIDHSGEQLAAAIAQNGIDILMPSFHPLTDAGLPWIGYLYDFQHKYLPHLFSEQERLQREVAFFRMVDSAATVVVNSRTVAADVRRFYPHTTADIVALPFSATPHPRWFPANPDTPRAYGITRPYFVICNQFWVHKDHWTAFLAFAKVAAAHPDIDLVCTGTTSDYRKPEYFPQLQAGVAALGLEARIHFVGHVSKDDQVALMANAIAVVQPTMFEGGPGGGAVYDAISLGVRAIVSDIPVNLELPPDGVTFFKANDQDALAAAMEATLAAAAPAPVAAETLLERGQDRRRAFGNVLLDAVSRACLPQARAA